jgi:hypothetical protein
MAGKHINLPQNFVVYQAFYLLRGGAVAQDLFFEVRTVALTEQFNLRFSTNNLDKLLSMSYHSDQFVELDNKKRTWLLDPSRSRTLEYISNGAPTDMNLWLQSQNDIFSNPGLIQAVENGWRVQWWRENEKMGQSNRAHFPL